MGNFKVWRYTRISPYQGSEVEIKKMYSSRNGSSSITTFSSLGSFEIGSANTSDFLDLVDLKSRSNSWIMTIDLLNFPLIIHRDNMY